MPEKRLKGVPEEAVLAVARVVRGLEKRGYRVRRVYIFGSYARGDWLKTSDVDAAIVAEGLSGTSFSARLDLVNEIVWSEKVEPYVEAFLYTPEEFEAIRERSFALRDASKYWVQFTAEELLKRLSAATSSEQL